MDANPDKVQFLKVAEDITSDVIAVFASMEEWALVHIPRASQALRWMDSLMSK